ncbi:MAG TPA: ABC transporter permease [Bryobacteraceae bacterium]|nr:ABC transporter permease [Bryobacteraceae bacterium]
MFGWFRRRRPSFQEIDEELQYHVEMLAREGAPARRLGNRTAIQETTLDAWGNARLDQIGRDIRFAARMFAREPGFYAPAALILALGIASAVSFFSLVDGVLLRPLPYRDPQRLVTLTAYDPKPPFASNGSVSYNDYRTFRARASSLADVAVTFRTGWSRVTLEDETGPMTIQGAFVSPELFPMMGRSPMLGRTFTEDENRRGERVAVISEALWKQRFGSSPDAVGQDLRFAHEQWRVIGVMPGDFEAPFLNTQLWAPVLSHPEWNNAEDGPPQDQPRWDLLARLRPGVSIAAAQAEVDSIENALKRATPDLHPGAVRVVPLREHFTGAVRKPLLILFCAVGCLLLIACANVANLLLARATKRERELSIRTALGAGRAALLRQLLIEAALFAGAAGALGMALAGILTPLLVRFAPAGTPLLDGVSIDSRVLLFAVAVSMAIGVSLGVVTAWRASRAEAADFLKAAGRTATEARQHGRLKNALVVAEFALATILLTGAGLLIHSFVAVESVNPGFAVDKVLTINVGLPDGTPAPELRRFYGEVEARLASLPGVVAVGGISNVFFLDESRVHALRQVEGHAPEPLSAWKPLVWAQVSGDYFQAMGIPLIHGRFFNALDTPDSAPVAIINETLARRYWGTENPVGKRLKGFDPRGRHDDWLTVVGVVRDTHSGGLERAPFSQIYEVQAQRGEHLNNLVVRTSGNAAVLAASVRQTIRSVNRNSFVTSIKTMEQLLQAQESGRRFQTWLVGVFSGLALLLAAIGVFAVMHYSVSARTSEIGIRIALGADARRITEMVLARGARLAIAGILAGALVARWAGEAIAGLLYQVRPGDPWSFAGAALVLFVVALWACWLPSRRAARIDPVIALRQE